MADSRIIAALDVHTPEDMKQLVEKLGDSVSFYKVGMELFYSAGPDTVRYLKAAGKRVFLDLKVHDIPHTAAQAMKALTRLGADLMTLHAGGGTAMMRAAADKKPNGSASSGPGFWRLPCLRVLMKLPGANSAIRPVSANRSGIWPVWLKRQVSTALFLPPVKRRK